MKCEKCGSNIGFGEKFCTNCGQVVNVSSENGVINIVRTKNYFGCAIPFKIFIDGTYVGDIKVGKTLTFNAPLGVHRVSINDASEKASTEVEITSEKKNVEVLVTVHFFALSFIAKGKIKSVKYL